MEQSPFRGIFEAKALLAAGLLLTGGTTMAQAVPVELKETTQGWQLFRDGEPYFIRGAGGTHHVFE